MSKGITINQFLVRVKGCRLLVRQSLATCGWKHTGESSSGCLSVFMMLNQVA